MEIAPGVHRVEAPLGARYVAMYLITGSRAALLVDSGVADSVEKALFPYLDTRGIARETLRYVINTHADWDHVGGNDALRQGVPGAMLMCGEPDRAMVGDVELMIRDRYGEFREEHGFDETDDSKAQIRSVAATIPVDIGLCGGEAINLGDRVVEVLHTPGHTLGHVSVYDEATRALVIGDAVLGESVLTAEGAPAFPPTYRYVDSYRATIRRLRSMRPEWLLTAHYPVYRGAAAEGFLDTSLAYTDRVEQAITSVLRESHVAMRLLEIVSASHELVGPWDKDDAAFLVYPILGHLEALEQRNVVARATDQDSGLATFTLR